MSGELDNIGLLYEKCGSDRSCFTRKKWYNDISYCFLKVVEIRNSYYSKNILICSIFRYLYCRFNKSRHVVIFSIMHFLGYYLPSDNFCYFASCTIILRVVLLFCELYYCFASCTIILRVVLLFCELSNVTSRMLLSRFRGNQRIYRENQTIKGFYNQAVQEPR